VRSAPLGLTQHVGINPTSQVRVNPLNTYSDFGAATHPGVGGGTHSRRATFDRCSVWGGGVRSCGCLFVVVFLSCCCVCDLFLFQHVGSQRQPSAGTARRCIPPCDRRAAWRTLCLRPQGCCRLGGAIYIHIYLSVYRSVYMSVYLSIYLCMCIYIYMYIYSLLGALYAYARRVAVVSEVLYIYIYIYILPPRDG